MGESRYPNRGINKNKNRTRRRCPRTNDDPAQAGFFFGSSPIQQEEPASRTFAGSNLTISMATSPSTTYRANESFRARFARPSAPFEDRARQRPGGTPYQRSKALVKAA